MWLTTHTMCSTHRTLSCQASTVDSFVFREVQISSNQIKQKMLLTRERSFKTKCLSIQFRAHIHSTCIASISAYFWPSDAVCQQQTHSHTNELLYAVAPPLSMWIVFYNSVIILVALVILGSQYSNIRVTATKLIRQDELVVVLILNNHKHPAISSITRPPSNLKACVHIIRSCDSHVTTTIRWSLQACAMNGSTNLSFTGSVEKFACVRQPITNDQWYHLFHSRHPILSGWFPRHHPSTWVWGERSTIVITSPHNRDCSSTLTLHVLTVEASWYSTIESACVYESLHVRRWGCDCATTFTPPPHHLHSSSSPPSLA